MGELVSARLIDGRYVNPWTAGDALSLEQARKRGRPTGNFANPSKEELERHPEMKVVHLIKKILSKAPEVGVQTTWLGHSTVLFQFDGLNVLTDPVFSKSVGNMQRYRDVPSLPQDLPRVDVVVISHDHFDHLDLGSITRLNTAFPDQITWFVPAGVKSLLPKECKKVVELKWWEAQVYRKESNEELNGSLIKGVESIIKQDTKESLTEATFTFVPANHSCQRKKSDSNTRLWGGWVIVGRRSRIYFCGDTGYCDIFKTIGEHYGPFDLAAIPIGGFQPRDVMKHMNCEPVDAVQIHKDVRAKRSLGIHWGTFMLGCEHFLDPIKKLQAALDEAELDDGTFVCLRHGETRVFAGQYEDLSAINNGSVYSRSKNQSSSVYSYDNLQEPRQYQKSSFVCTIL